MKRMKRMKRIRSRIISFILVLALAVTNGNVAAWACGEDSAVAIQELSGDKLNELTDTSTETAESLEEIGETEEKNISVITSEPAGAESEETEQATDSAEEQSEEDSSEEDIITVTLDAFDCEKIDEEMASVPAVISNDLSSSGDSTDTRAEQLKELIVNSFLAYESSVDLSEYNFTYNEVLQAFYDLTRTEYRIFFVKNAWSFSYNNSTGIIISVTASYTMECDEAAEKLAYLEAVIDEIVNAADDSWTDMEKVLYINDYLTRTCEYDSSENNYTAYGALVEHAAVCQGYSMAFYTLAKRLGLTCGVVRSTELLHAWNYVQIGDHYYCVDVTWDDPTTDRLGRAKHNYLLKSYSWFVSDEGGHAADDWMYLGDNSDELDTSCFADNSYDDYFWDDIDCGFEYIDGFWYTFDADDLNVYLYEEENNTFACTQTLLTVSDRWYVWDDDSGQYWTHDGSKVYAYTASYEDVLYYSTTNTIWYYDFDTESSAVLYTLSDTEAEQGYIYGIRVMDGSLDYRLSSSPKTSDTIGIYTVLEADEEELADISSCAITVEKSPVYNGTLQVPELTVADGTYTLKEGLDYAVGCLNNVDVGNKTLYLVGVGAYTGMVKVGFYILYEAPSFTQVYNSTTGIVFCFDEVDEVGTYRFYRRASTSDEWESIGYASSSPCMDTNVESGTTYYYAMQYYTSDGKTALSDLDDTGYKYMYLSGVYFSLTNTASGMQVSWDEVTSANGYYVYRKADSGNTTLVKTITGGSVLSWVDTSVSSGTTYTYYVNAYNGTYLGPLLSCSFMYLGTPVISSAANASSGVKVKWSEVAGVDGYYILRSTSSGSGYSYIGTVASASTLTYTDTSASGGTTYYYKVQAYSGSYGGAESSYKSIKYLTQGKISSLTNVTSGITVKWSKVTGATGYYIYRKASGSSYSLIKTITSGSTVSYTDTGVKSKSGTTYTYYVRPYYKSGSTTYTGTYTTKSIRRLSSASVSSLTNTSSGITVKWGKITGANGYYIYRKAGSGSYSLAKTITSGSTVSYTDTAAKSKNGTTYTYYVIPYYKNSSGTVTKGSHANTKKIVRLTAVSLSSVKNSSSRKMTVKWAKNSKATGYQIQYSTSSSFSSYKTVTVSGASTVSKTISSLTRGKTYYVRIRVYKTVSGTKYYSAWSSKKSVKISK